MGKISTIQKNEKLNEIYAGEKGDGGASHCYMIAKTGSVRQCDGSDILTVNPEDVVEAIQFQEGARYAPKSVHGVTDEDLLEIVRDRLKGFVNGSMSTRETEHALKHVEEALMWLNMRIEDRIERNVLGTYNR